MWLLGEIPNLLWFHVWGLLTYIGRYPNALSVSLSRPKVPTIMFKKKSVHLSCGLVILNGNEYQRLQHVGFLWITHNYHVSFGDSPSNFGGWNTSWHRFTRAERRWKKTSTVPLATWTDTLERWASWFGKDFLPYVWSSVSYTYTSACSNLYRQPFCYV